MSDALPGFNELELSEPVLTALESAGYESPTPIQAKTIPLILSGQDVLGQAQTGTGKTAAFALPVLSKIDLKVKKPQVLVLTPTRELAIQVAEAFQRYASKMKGFHVLPVYGGQDYQIQMKQLNRGVHVIVGTPGRLMDHMRRGSIKLNEMRTLILDEADEMLRMGFIDDVEWILQQTPEAHQTALFSATMPDVIRKITKKYLTSPAEVTIKVKTTTADTINQRFWMVSGFHKLDALTRILEAETFDAMIIFVRTKMATMELAEKLEARGYSSAALNGDIAQNQRERTVNQLKQGKIDILVATDVAARGLDVQRISHVVNYDVPYDTEAYVHRIGRTGRAGRTGEAILFVAPREKRMLKSIERATKKPIEPMELPSTDIINNNRIAKFTQTITDTLATEELEFFTQLLEKYEHEHDVSFLEIAAALAKIAQGDKPLLLKDRPMKKERSRNDRDSKRERGAQRERGSRREKGESGRNRSDRDDLDFESYKVQVGHDHGVKPGNIVGAIANEAGLDSDHIGRIDIYDEYSLVDLPAGMPRDVFEDLKRTWVSGQQLRIARANPQDKSSDKPKKKFKDSDRSAPRKNNDDTKPRNKGPRKAKKSVDGKKRNSEKRKSAKS